jgi:hypothetical protein
MADCKWPGGCKEGTKGKAAAAVAKSIFCDKHRRKHDEDEKIKRQKEQVAKELKEREEKQLEMARLAKAKQDAEDQRKLKIQQIKGQWNQQVQAVVQQVKNLRAHNPGVDGINAGNNAVGNTPGGTNNALELKLPSDAKGIAKGDIFPLMTGFDGSDSSGGIKIRINDSKGNILVHVH